MLFKAVCFARWRANSCICTIQRRDAPNRIAWSSPLIRNSSDQSVDSKLRPRLDPRSCSRVRRLTPSLFGYTFSGQCQKRYSKSRYLVVATARSLSSILAPMRISTLASRRPSKLALAFLLGFWPWSAIAVAAEKVSGTGTGFFITPDGYFLTNYHVIEGSEKVGIRNGESITDAKLIRRDEANDIAILKAEGHFVCLTIGLSNRVKIGDDVFTIGFPAPDLQGVAPKLTKGNISATSGLKDDPRFFQISIPVQPGNSGGPLIDERGNAVGIVASTLSPAIALSKGFIPQNVNFAVKTTYAMPLIETIRGLKEQLPAINASTLRSVSEIREAAANAVGLVIVYGGSKKQTQKSKPEPQTVEDSDAIVAQVTDLEKKWQASVRAHDASVAEAVLSEDFVGEAPSGRLTDKAFIVSGIASDTSNYEIARVEEIHVQVVSAKTAIATGIGHEKGKDNRRKPFDRVIAFTDTWQQREGRWLCTRSKARFVARR
jgi:S1-C subfamily serine protease